MGEVKGYEDLRLTKVYPTTGIITLDASQFGENQEVLDIEIRNSEPIKAAVERLSELEDRNEPRSPKEEYDEVVCSCGARWNYCDNETDRFKYCPYCGQRWE